MCDPCPKKPEYFSSYEDLLREKNKELENEEKNDYIPKFCQVLKTTTQVWRSAYTEAYPGNLEGKNISLECKVNLSSVENSCGLLTWGTGTKCAGNIILGVSSGGKLYLGVQCNGRNSNSPISSKATLAKDTTYVVKGTYDGKTAALYIDGELDNSVSKKFIYNNAVTIGIGTGDLSKATENIPEGSSISKLNIEVCNKGAGKCVNKPCGKACSK